MYHMFVCFCGNTCNLQTIDTHLNLYVSQPVPRYDDRRYTSDDTTTYLLCIRISSLLTAQSHTSIKICFLLAYVSLLVSVTRPTYALIETTRIPITTFTVHVTRLSDLHTFTFVDVHTHTHTRARAHMHTHIHSHALCWWNPVMIT